MQRLFVPGLGARVRAYSGLPPEWEPLQPPAGSLRTLHHWLHDEIRRRPVPVVVAGHSMGGALAVIAAAHFPGAIAGLVLIAPAGLPLQKPIRASLADLGRQLSRGTHDLRDVASSLRMLARAPRASLRLVRSLRRLDLSTEMRIVREAGIPVTVVGCRRDTLVPPVLARQIASLLGASYAELDAADGHVWPIARRDLLAAELHHRSAVSIYG
jgi:pimeloyl-ACP methyl ester carboxylesterase